MSAKIADIYFAISMFWLLAYFYQIAFIAKLILFFLYISPSFPWSAKAESNTESLQKILHSNSFVEKWNYIRVQSKYVNTMCTTCIIVD